MDAIKNPFRPGAGTSPPELAGRDAVRKKIRLALARAKTGRPEKPALLVGLRGVGKTVLLSRLHLEAKNEGISAWMEISENRALSAVLLPELRAALMELSGKKRAKEQAKRALRAVAGFARTLKIEYLGMSFGFAPEPGLADSGDLESDLSVLLKEAGRAAAAENTYLALFVDELQYAKQAELSALIAAMHRAAQEDLPVVMAGAGLPRLRGDVGGAKSYAERMFDFYEIGALDKENAAHALRKPAQDEGADFTKEAVLEIIGKTRGYPYFLQEWGKHAWDAAAASPINAGDVKIASARAMASLDAGFFSIRMDRLTANEKRYLRAMAKIGKEPMRSGEIARELKQKINETAPVRARLIEKGMIWSPGHGKTAFTVPQFGEYLRRIGAPVRTKKALRR